IPERDYSSHIELLTYFFPFSFFFQAEDGIRDRNVTGVQTCALPISVLPAISAGSQRGERSPSRYGRKYRPPVSASSVSASCARADRVRYEGSGESSSLIQVAEAPAACMVAVGT